MIALILCLRPMRVPKFIWFKILRARRYEFGIELCANETPDEIFTGACAAGNLSLVKKTYNGNTRLTKGVLAACRASHMHVLTFLVEETRIAREVLYYYAARAGSEELLEYLYMHYPAKHFDTESALVSGAIRGGQTDFLIKHKYITECNIETLVLAVKSGCLSTVKYVVNGVKGSYMGKIIHAGLVAACKKKFIDIMDYFLVILKNQTHTVQAFDLFYIEETICEFINDDELFYFLTRYVDSLDGCMYAACSANRIDRLEYLHNAGANYYLGCVRRAFQLGHNNIIDYLLQKGLSYDAEDIITACCHGQLETVKIYARPEHFADIMKGIYFDEEVEENIIEYLLSRGAKKPIY